MKDELNVGFHPFGAFDGSRMQRVAKVLSYAGTSGALVLEALDSEIERLVNYKNVVRLNVPRIGGESDAYKVVQRSAGSTPGEFVAETGDFTDSEGSYADASFAFKTLGGRGKVTRFAQATGRSFTNVMAQEIDGRMEDFRDYEEYCFFYANSNTSNQFKGLHQLIDVSQHVGCTTGSTPVSLTQAALDALWDETKNDPDMAFTSLKGRRLINAVLQSKQRFNDVVTINGGFMVNTYNGTPIVKSSRIVDTNVFNGTTVTATTGGTSSIIYTVSFDKMFIAELTPLSFMPLARTSSQWERYDIFEDVAPVLKNKYHAALLAGFK